MDKWAKPYPVKVYNDQAFGICDCIHSHDYVLIGKEDLTTFGTIFTYKCHGCGEVLIKHVDYTIESMEVSEFK